MRGIQLILAFTKDENSTLARSNPSHLTGTHRNREHTFTAAAAMAFLALNASVPFAQRKLENENAISKFGQNGAGLIRNRFPLPGPEREGGPWTAAEEDYAHRAYPAKDVSLGATLNAIASFKQVEAISKVKARFIGRPTPDAWQLIGPSKADVPAVLTHNGTKYTASGRITALAVDPGCTYTRCPVWAAAARGGIWKTDNALSGRVTWKFVSSSFSTNAIGSLTYDSANDILYAGTGEPNDSADSAAGLGIRKSSDGGNTWTQLAALIGPITTISPGTGTNGTYGPGNAFLGRAIGSIAVDPTNSNHLYVASGRGVRGISSVTGGGSENPPTPRPPFGLFESTDGGATFSFIWDGGDGCPATCDGTNRKATIHGVNKVQLDPGWNGTTNKILYGGAFGPTGVPGGGGVWRSTNGGVTWTQIKSARNVRNNKDRAEFAVAAIMGGFTRMYVGVGNSSTTALDQAHFYRTDNAAGAAVFHRPNDFSKRWLLHPSMLVRQRRLLTPGKTGCRLPRRIRQQWARVLALERCGRVVHRYDLGLDHKPNTAR